MSYNLLLDTNFTKIGKHWKLNNCEYRDGYLIGKGKVFSIEQEITLPDPTKIYFGIDYICFDKNIKHIYCGVFTKDGELKANRKKPFIKFRKRISSISTIKEEKFKVMLIIESKSQDSKLYIDGPLLIDLNHQGKKDWPRWILNKCLDYRYGYDYENEYVLGSEITLKNNDFNSPYVKNISANVGILSIIEKMGEFKISHNFKENDYYLIKLDYQQLNLYGEIYLKYGEVVSTPLGDEQSYILFKANKENNLVIKLKNVENLPYMVNFKHILIINLTHVKLEEDDIAHLPFI